MSSTVHVAFVIAIPLSFFLLAFVVGCFEKRRVRMFQPAKIENPTGYMQATMQCAIARGCGYIGSGCHTKYKEKVSAVLLLSSDRRVLILIGQGTIARLPYRETILMSSLKNGGFLFTVDLAGAAELDPLTSRQILMKADFNEMLNKHNTRLQEGAIPLPFSDKSDWTAVDQIYRARVDRMVKGGLARYVDKNHEVYCYSAWGSFRATILHGLGQVLRPSNFMRHYKRQPG